jgi:sterol 14-demethylase
MELQQIVQKTLHRKSPSRPPELRDPPELSGGLPVVGHTVDFARSTIDLLFRAHQEHGEIAQFQVAHRRLVALFGPEGHQAMFRAPDTQLSPSDPYKIMTPVFGEGLVYDAPPDKMNEQLKMLLPALKDRRMRTYGEIILEEVERAIADWGEEGEFDLVDFCRVLTNFTSSHCLIGREFRENMSEEFARVYHDLERGVTPIAYINPYLPLPSFRKRDKARERLEQMISGIIEERKRSHREGEDFLQTLMDSRYKTGAPLTDHEITGMLLASMFAGHHTSSVTTAWSLIELLQKPEELDAVVGELAGIFGDEGVVDYQSLRRAERTEWAVKETLRLHPPLFMLVRGARQDFRFKDYHIPAGTYVTCSPHVAHRMPEYFRDPETFDPSRFGPGREEDKVNFAYIPFGGGRHKCMGNAFALLQIKAILAVLLRKFEFEPVGDPVQSDFHGLVVGPSEPFRLRYRKRKQPVTEAVPEHLQRVQSAEEATPEPAKPIARIEVDRDLCQGHAVCIEEAPNIFKLDEHHKVTLKQTEPDPRDYDKVRQAARYCPTRAIRPIDKDDASAAE